MKIITLKKKKILKLNMFIIFALIICGFTTSFAMQHYYNLDFSTGLVTASTLNVRSGPGTQFKIIATVPKNQYIREEIYPFLHHESQNMIYFKTFYE